jgi:hypothetical protein
MSILPQKQLNSIFCFIFQLQVLVAKAAAHCIDLDLEDRRVLFGQMEENCCSYWLCWAKQQNQSPAALVCHLTNDKMGRKGGSWYSAQSLVASVMQALFMIHFHCSWLWMQ